MRKAMYRLLFSFIGIIIIGYTLSAPLAAAGYAAEKSMPVSDNMEPVPKTAMNFGNSDPVATVTGAAEILGFNPKVDTFTLIKQEASHAIVRVLHNGADFDVTLELSSGGVWMIATMNSST